MENVYVVIVEKFTSGNWIDKCEIIETVVFKTEEKAKEYKDKREEESLIYCLIKKAILKEK